MQFSIATLALLASFQVNATCSSFGDESLESRQAVGPPSQDPFYVPPSGFNRLPLGSILRSRSLNNLATSLGLKSAQQLLYSTQDDVGRKGATVTTILIPNNADFSKHLSYHAPYDTANVDCSPSYPLALGNAPQGLDAQVISSALQKNIPVSIPDYEGPDAAFTAGPQSAFGALDAIKAVVASRNITGILPTAKTIMFGYSGGSIPVEWAAEYHTSYAPQVNIVAAALGGLPANLNTALGAIASSSSPGLAFASLNGLASSYPSFSTWLSNNLIASKADAFYKAKTSCDLGIYNNQNIFTYFKNGSASFNQPGYTDVITRAGVMGRHAIPKEYPLWIYKGTIDEIVPTIAETDALVKGYCDNGSTIKYFRYINGTHSSTLNLTPNALTFLFGVIGGTPAPAGCTVQNVSP